MRNNYWSCSKFADLVRGTEKPNSGTGNEWNLWRRTAKTRHAIRFWLAETGLSAIQNLLYFPYDAWNNTRWYIKNRWFTHSHALTASKKNLRRGQWCDLGNRFIPCLFDELVNFVEIECAWMQMAFDDTEKKKLPLLHRLRSLRFSPWRSREAGLANLDWQASLIFDKSYFIDATDSRYGKPTFQALNAQEIRSLYLWYTDNYLKRPDPYDLSGWTAYCEEKRKISGDNLSFFDNENESDTLRERREKAFVRLREIEKAYDDEETEMLIRLIKIRDSLWT